MKNTTKGFSLRAARRNAGFTLAEIMVVLVLLAMIAAAALPALNKAIARGQARNTLRVIAEVKNAKDQLAAEVQAGSIAFSSLHGTPPADIDSFESSYVPTIDDLGPYLKVNGVQEGTVPTAQQLMAGTGQRTMSYNAMDTDPTVTPAVDSTLLIK